jgi:CRISPR-associated protein Cmr1
MFNISRFKDIERHEYECEVVTPLFLGGADPKRAELRAPPIKAAMRFWWRAMNAEKDIKKMSAAEADIFGSTDRKAVVNIRIENVNSKPVLKDLPPGKMMPVEGKPYKTSIINYLSYGLFEHKKAVGNVYIKEHIEPMTCFRMIITFPKRFEVDILQTMKAMISFGGIGARSRNGFGSIYCNVLIDHALAKTGDLKSFTSFSRESILFDKFRVYDKWEDALSEIGEVYRNARLRLERKHIWNKRKFIAMPIEAQRENIPESIRHGRHAKPYFLHVNKTHEGKYRGQILFLPYQYKAGPNDSLDRSAEYMEVCRKMNKEILKGMGGSQR